MKHLSHHLLREGIIGFTTTGTYLGYHILAREYEFLGLLLGGISIPFGLIAFHYFERRIEQQEAAQKQEERHQHMMRLFHSNPLLQAHFQAICDAWKTELTHQSLQRATEDDA